MFSMIGGGLLQLWILVFILSLNGAPVSLVQVLGDGILFFFASSLAVGSAITLFDSPKMAFGNVDFNVTCTVGLGLVFVTAVTYSYVLADVGFAAPDPFQDLVLFQIGIAFIALGYWFYTGVRTGLYTRKSS